jgi:Mn-dependent DtxR family transcriptional regulator
MSKKQYFNVNDYVYVRLTDEGKKVMADGLRKLGLREELITDIISGKEKETKDGWTRFQLHDLMNTFGHVMINGNPRLPFETRIRLGEKA